MLKKQEVTANIDGFIVGEVDAEDAIDFHDNLKTKYESASGAKFRVILTREMFVLRVKDWPDALGECNDENKRLFFNEYTVRANEMLLAAEREIKNKRDELLKNLLAGVSGN